MTDLIVVPHTNQWHKLKTLVLDSVSSPITKRVYNLGLDEFFAWYGQEARSGFTKAAVSAWRVSLEARGLGSISINVRITAVRKLAVDAWALGAGVITGQVFRAVDRGDRVRSLALSEKVVWQLLQQYAAAIGAPGIAPHDLRRTCAKMCRAAGGELEQIQLLLGHGSAQTTERYLGTKQDLVHAPNDGIKLKVAV